MYVAITNGYFDAHGNRGAAANATFSVDTTAPAAPTFSPADGARVGNAGRNITLTFTEAIRKDANGGEFDTSGDLEAILTLKRTDGNGADIDFSAALGTDGTVITIDPDADLAEGAVHVAVTNGYYDEAGNQGSAASATFTLDTSVAAPTFSPADGEQCEGHRTSPDHHAQLRRGHPQGRQHRHRLLHHAAESSRGSSG